MSPAQPLQFTGRKTDIPSLAQESFIHGGGGEMENTCMLQSLGCYKQASLGSGYQASQNNNTMDKGFCKLVVSYKMQSSPCKAKPSNQVGLEQCWGQKHSGLTLKTAVEPP